jgi:hypothetical protein
MGHNNRSRDRTARPRQAGLGGSLCVFSVGMTFPRRRVPGQLANDVQGES